MRKLTQEKAVEMLAGMDHGFVSPEGARDIGGAFGFMPRLYFETVNSRAFKGLSVPGKEDGEQVEGIAAHDLAAGICQHLKLATASSIGIEGRGSALRFNVEQIKKYLSQQRVTKRIRKRLSDSGLY